MALDMEFERRIAAIETDVAVIRATTENHYSELRADMSDLKSDVTGTRDKVERLFNTVMARLPSPQQKGGGNGPTVQLAIMGAGWLFALLMLILQYLLGSRP